MCRRYIAQHQLFSNQIEHVSADQLLNPYAAGTCPFVAIFVKWSACIDANLLQCTSRLPTLKATHIRPQDICLRVDEGMIAVFRFECTIQRADIISISLPPVAEQELAEAGRNSGKVL